MSVDLKFVELTADVFALFFIKWDDDFFFAKVSMITTASFSGILFFYFSILLYA